MNDIVERLRFRADENYEMLGNIHEPLLEAAAEIERLRAAIGETLLEREDARAEVERLRAGGCARDQGTTQYCAEAAKLAAEIERLREWNAEIALNAREFAAENERLRAVLREIAKVTYGWEPGVWSDEEGRNYFASLFFDAQAKARAALEGK